MKRSVRRLVVRCEVLFAVLGALGVATAADNSGYYDASYGASYYGSASIGTTSVVESSQVMSVAAGGNACGCACPNDCYNGCDDYCLDPWAFSFIQTVEYGTNLALPITLTPLNVVTPVFEDDFQFQTTARLQRQWMLDCGDSFIMGMGYYQNLHPEVEELDLMTPSAYAQYNRRISDRVVGTLDYNYSYYFLDGSSYVSQNRWGGSLLFRQDDWWDWKARADYANADFRTTNDLDSDNYSAQVEAIRYMSDERRDYWTAGAGAGYSDAFNDGFTYDVSSVFLGSRWYMGCCDEYDLLVLAAYAVYDFDAPDPLVPAVVRRDEILTINTTLTWTLDDVWRMFGSYTYLNSDSNVVRQQYHQNIVALGVAGTW